MSEQVTHLTEVIIAIQHEIQLALDYIETVVSQESSELGAASSLITVEKMRVCIPLIFQTEEVVTDSIPSVERPYIPGTRLPPEDLKLLKSKLANRYGLYLGLDEGKRRFVKVRIKTPVNLEPAPDDASAPAVEPIIGEIELNLTRIPRDLLKSPSKANMDGDRVPDVVGLSLDEARKLLEQRGWEAEPRAASNEEISTFPTVLPGRVLRQDPQAGSKLDKQQTLVRFWLVLSTLPVSEIDGIGPVLKDRLAEAGIENVGELSLANSEFVGAAIRASEIRSQHFIDMANLMSRLSIAGLRDEVVEILIKGVNIRSIEQLAAAEGDELYRVCHEVVTSKKVRVPREFSFTKEDVQDWISSAQSSLRSR